MKKIVAASTAAVALTGGSLVVASLFPLGLAGAQDGTTTTTEATGDSTAKPERGEALNSVLDALVTDGTLTQAQADAVSAGMEQWRTDHPAPEHGRGGGRLFGADLDEIAAILGLTVDELRTDLAADGATLASVAGDQVDEVEALLTERATSRIDQALADGKMDEAAATEMKAAIGDKVTAMLDETATIGRRGGGPGHDHRGGHADGAAEDPPASTTTIS